METRYLDVIWLDNVIMNFLLLYAVCKLTKNKASLWRIWLAAALGALYVVFLLLPVFPMLRHPMSKVSLSVLMLLTTFRITSLREFIKLTACFYTVTFLFGGTAFGLYYFFSSSIGYAGGVFYIRNFPVKMLFFTTVLIASLYRMLWPVFKARMHRTRLLYQMEIQFDGSSKIIEALLDTGNDLNDPISSTPVMVVEFAELQALLPKDICSIFQQSKDTNLELVTRIMADSPWINRFRIVPFQALGKSCGMLLGYKPDKVKILLDEGWREIEDIIVGVYNQRLSSDSDYHALIHPQIIP